MRRHAAGERPEAGIVGHFGGRLELPQPAHERPQQDEPVRRCSAVDQTIHHVIGLDLMRPLHHQLNRQWPDVVGVGDEAFEFGQGASS